jgi:DNA-3-methyladenine glycosylase II
MAQSPHHRFLAIAPDLSPTLHDALRRVGPVELPVRDHIPFPEHLARAVAGQQLSVKAARSIWSRVETACSDAPLIEAFCEGRAGELRACGLSNAKVKTLLAIGHAAREGRLDGDALRALTPAKRAAELTSLWGVGQWTADMANMFWFGEEDIWPEGDVAARKTLERLTSPRRKTVRTAERFAPHRSYLALYMWRWVDARPG